MTPCPYSRSKQPNHILVFLPWASKIIAYFDEHLTCRISIGDTPECEPSTVRQCAWKVYIAAIETKHLQGYKRQRNRLIDCRVCKNK